MLENFTGALTGSKSSRGICFWALKPEITLNDADSHHKIMLCNEVLKIE
jgi:hypothetical protein